MSVRFIICFILFSNYLFSQEIIILDANNNPVNNAAVFNSKKTISAISNLDGLVNLNRFLNNELIYFQHAKYTAEPTKKSILLSNKSWRVTDFVYKIPEVTLNNNKNADNIKNSAEKKIFITKMDIQKFNTENLADLLEKKGGISVQKSQFGGGSPNIRGFEANKILLVLDGVRLNNAIYRSGHLQNIITIDESVLENTHVIFGPNSVIYGSDALGGTISMETKRLYFSNDPKIQTQFFSRYANAYNGFSSHQSLLYQSKKISLFNAISIKDYGDVQMGKNRSHGYSDWGIIHHYQDQENDTIVMNPNPDIQKNTGFQQLDFINKMLFKLNHQWRITSNLQYSTSSNVPRFDKLNDLGDEACDNCDESLPKYLYWHYGPQNRFFSSLSLLGVKKTALFDRAEFIVGNQRIIESRNQQKINEDSIVQRKEIVDILSLNANLKKGNLSYGLESIYNHVSSQTNTQQFGIGSTRYPGNGSSTFSTAIYVNYFKSLHKNLHVEFGARHTLSYLKANFSDSIPRDALGLESLKVASDWSVLSGNTKLVYYPSEKWKISAVLSKGFHSPNVDDVAKVFVKGDRITVPNINLNTEIAYSEELSISKQLNDWGLIYFTGFYTQIKNAILKDTISVNVNASVNGANIMMKDTILYENEYYAVFANQNIERIDIYGCTFGFEASLSKSLSLHGDINYTKGINKANITNPVPHIPPVFGKLSLQKKNGKLTGFIDFQYSLKKESSDFDAGGVDNLEETPYDEAAGEYVGLPSWNSLNLSLSYNLSNHASLQLSVNNIFDQHYKSFGSGMSAPGRNFITTFRLNY